MSSNVPQSPASEEMPEWVRQQVEAIRGFAGPSLRERVIACLADRVDALTRELSESRARAAQAEIDHARRERGYERRLAWIDEQLQRGVGPVTFSLTENGTIGVWGPEASRDNAALCDGSGDTADEALASARRHSPTRELSEARARAVQERLDGARAAIKAAQSICESRSSSLMNQKPIRRISESNEASKCALAIGSMWRDALPTDDPLYLKWTLLPATSTPTPDTGRPTNAE